VDGELLRECLDDAIQFSSDDGDNERINTLWTIVLQKSISFLPEENLLFGLILDRQVLQKKIDLNKLV
jgi:hypothetical protein